MEPAKTLKILGERIRRARKKTGWSQEELAFRTEIDRSYMGGIERGQYNLSLSKLCTIARVLKKDLGNLLRGLPDD